MKNETVRQNAFKLELTHKQAQPFTGDKFLSMREWQKRAFEELRDNPLMILNAPMGSGKSLLMCFLSAYKMKKNNALLSIIAVPQTIIASGFANEKLQMPDGENLEWQPKHNLCKKGNDNGNDNGTVNYMINWLTSSHNSLNEKVLICTHATLVKMYKKLKDEGNLHLLTNLLFWIDEAHHVKNIAMEGFEGGIISNGIGDLVAYILSQKHNDLQLGLTTASFFRGDRYSLLTQNMETQFKRFNLTYPEYLQYTNLKSFNFDFLLCGPEYTNAIGILAKQRRGKDIIYIPHPKSRHSSGDKYQEVEKIVDEYHKIYGGELTDSNEGLTILKSENEDFKILDLVDENQRIEKKEFINSKDFKEKRSAVDVIIALGMFKEGANWIWADRSIIVGARASLVDIVQMLGRLFRDAEGKQHVEAIQLLPFSLDQQSDSFRENLNNYLKAIYASLILEDILNPIKIKAPSNLNIQNSFISEDFNQKSVKPLSDLIPDEAIQLAVIEDAFSRLSNVNSENKYEEYKNEMPTILKEYGITSNIEEISNHIWNILCRPSLKMHGIAIEDIDFDIVKSIDPLEGLLRYTSGTCGINTLLQLKAAIRSYHDENEARWKINYGLVTKYADEHEHCRIHKNYTTLVDGKIIKLGSWYSDQKKNFYSLPLSKQELLQKLPGFIAKKFRRNNTLSTDEWTDLFISVSKKLGTPLIPNSHVENGFNLGAWMQHIRKNEEWGKLTLDQQKRLLENNFKISPSKEHSEAAVMAMAQFALREETTIPNSKHHEEVVYKGIRYSIPLYNWRNKIKSAPETVEPEILEGMRNIPNFMKELKNDNEDRDESLEKGLNLYRKFKERTGKTILSNGCVEDGVDLFCWNKKIRTTRNLNPELKANILHIDPHFFSPHTIRIFFQDVHPRIEDFIKRNGHAIIPQEHVCSDGYLLGQKISDLRERKGMLKQPVIEYLNSLGNKWVWNYFKHQTNQDIQRFISYIKLNGLQELPKDIQILKFKVKKALAKDASLEEYKKQIEKLAPGVFDEPKDENYEALLKYSKREGHACPPIKHIEDGHKIGYYVSNIRQKKKNGRLSREKQTKFEALKGWRWSAVELQSSIKRKIDKS